MSIRDKAIEAAARAMCAKDGWSSSMWPLAGTALNAILTVLAEPNAEMAEAGGFVVFDGWDNYDTSADIAAACHKAMIAKVSE